MAKDNLKMLFYRNKTTFFFDEYITNMKQTFNVIDDYNVPLYEEDKVRQLLDEINGLNNNLKNEVDICRAIHSSSFKTASTHLSTFISHLFPENQSSSRRYG